MTAKELRTYTDLKEQLKQYCDQFLSESDMTRERLVWIVCGINRKAPVYIALQAAYDTMTEWENVQRGIMPHW